MKTVSLIRYLKPLPLVRIHKSDAAIIVKFLYSRISVWWWLGGWNAAAQQRNRLDERGNAIRPLWLARQ